VLVVACCFLNGLVSAGLIGFNKYLMSPGRFPYAVPLVTMHCVVSTIFIFALWLLHRKFGSAETGFFSTMPDILQLHEAGTWRLKRKVFTIALAYAAQLVISNISFLYSSLVFIQMLKEVNLVFVYFLSVFVALEVMNRQRVQVLCVIVFATLLTVKGELNFTWLGFAIQGAGQIFEVTRLILQNLLLSGSGLKLDVLSYVLLVMPACAILLGGLMVVNQCVAQPFIAMPTRAIVVQWWPQLLMNGLLAFALNVTTALAVKYASAVGMILAGILKDTSIVCVGACFFAERVSALQGLGFSMQMMGIATYSYMRLRPETFADGIVKGVVRFLPNPVKSKPTRAADLAKLYGSLPTHKSGTTP
jgi:hypothetical protein